MPVITKNGTVDTIKNGDVTKKGTMDGDECSVYASNYYYSTYYWFKAFDKKYGSNANATILNLKKRSQRNSIR